MQQNASRDSWTFEHTEAPAGRDHGGASTSAAHATADEYGRPGDYVLGANIAGFVRVADAMLAMGVV